MRYSILIFCLFLFGFQLKLTTCAAPAPKCSLPLEVGPCRMKLPRFYYNPATKSCEQFIYGGCRGNDNRFGIISACEDACKSKK